MILTVLVLEHDLYTKHLSKPVQKLRHHLEGQVHISNPGSPLKMVLQKTEIKLDSLHWETLKLVHVFLSPIQWDKI